MYLATIPQTSSSFCVWCCKLPAIPFIVKHWENGSLVARRQTYQPWIGTWKQIKSGLLGQRNWPQRCFKLKLKRLVLPLALLVVCDLWPLPCSSPIGRPYLHYLLTYLDGPRSNGGKTLGYFVFVLIVTNFFWLRRFTSRQTQKSLRLQIDRPAMAILIYHPE